MHYSVCLSDLIKPLPFVWINTQLTQSLKRAKEEVYVRQPMLGVFFTKSLGHRNEDNP